MCLALSVTLIWAGSRDLKKGGSALPSPQGNGGRGVGGEGRPNSRGPTHCLQNPFTSQGGGDIRRF